MGSSKQLEVDEVLSTCMLAVACGDVWLCCAMLEKKRIEKTRLPAAMYDVAAA